MSIIKPVTVAAAAMAIAASAHAAGEFAFDYTYDATALSSEAGAIGVLEGLEGRIEEECQFSRFTERFTFARKITKTCVVETLERVVEDINAPHLNAAFEQWQEKRT
ncbi:MAG: hypothetical protein AAF829_08090 [Pseudomonadota bacterium]